MTRDRRSLEPLDPEAVHFDARPSPTNVAGLGLAVVAVVLIAS